MARRNLELKYLGIPVDVKLALKETEKSTGCVIGPSVTGTSTQCTVSRENVVGFKNLDCYTNDSDSEELPLRELAYRIGCKRVFINDYDSEDDKPILYVRNRNKSFKC